jgi:signal transduction histidine kinase
MNQISALNPDIEKLQIISVTGEILFDSDQLASNQKPDKQGKINETGVLEKIKDNKGSEIGRSDSSSQPGQIIEPYFADFGAHPFSIRYLVSYDSISENILGTIIATILLSLIFFAGAITLIIVVVTKSIINPIEAVIEGTQFIGRGFLSHKIETEAKDEVVDLAAAVNQMAQTLKKNIEDLRELDKLKDEFVFLASHNLRTPLTVIKGYVTDLRRKIGLDSETRKSVERISEATGELEVITESLVDLVTVEKEKQPLLVSEVEVPSLVREASDKYSQEAAQKRISFVFELPSKPLPKLEVDKQRITQAFSSLIDNAIKFNKKGGKVTIKVEEKDKSILVSIKDTGIGISKEEADKVFQKFHRATDVLKYEYEGVGLGLYITRLIIEAHLGKIWYESKQGEGSTFFVSLPIREEG